MKFLEPRGRVRQKVVYTPIKDQSHEPDFWSQDPVLSHTLTPCSTHRYRIESDSVPLSQTNLIMIHSTSGEWFQ